MYLQKEISRKKQFLVGVLEVNDENSRIQIRIYKSEAWIRGSGSEPKCHGFVTLPPPPPPKKKTEEKEMRTCLYWVLFCCSSSSSSSLSYFIIPGSGLEITANKTL
jgi:hypothetical protein